MISVLIGWWILFTFLFVGSIHSVNAQIADVYLDVGVSYTVFLRKGDIQVDNTWLSPKVGAGISFFLNDKQLWKIKSEFKFSGRNYDTTFPESHFQFRARGLEINTLAEYSFSEKFSFEGGLGLYFYEIFLLENNVPRLLGDQSRSFDVNLIAGVSYQIYEPFFIGFRTSLGLVPMVKTQAVGKFGDMVGEQHLLNALTPELFFRIKFYRRNKT